jgi:hypothetical protein
MASDSGSAGVGGRRREVSVAEGLREEPRAWVPADDRWIAELVAEESSPLMGASVSDDDGPRVQTREHPDARDVIAGLLRGRRR